MRAVEGPTWIVGTGEATAADHEDSLAGAISERVAAALLSGATPPPGEPGGRVEAARFELFRALTGRRSLGQIRRFSWDVDPEPYLRAFEWARSARRRPAYTAELPTRGGAAPGRAPHMPCRRQSRRAGAVTSPSRTHNSRTLRKESTTYLRAAGSLR